MKTDNELIKRAKEGDKEAMSELLRRYEPLIKNLSRKKHLRAIEDEVRSEAYLSFIAGVKKFDTERGIPFCGYIKKIILGAIYTLFKKHCRTSEREKLIADDESGFGFWEKIESGRDEYGKFLSAEAMKKALSLLEKGEREVIASLYFSQRTQSETAKLIGITQQAVAKKKEKALKKLKEYFEKF